MDFSRLPYEIQFEYLLQLSYSNVISYCVTSSSALRVCRDDEFWRSKISRDLGPDLDRFKPNDQTFFQQYLRLSQLESVYESVIEHPIIEAYDPRSGDFDVDVYDEFVKWVFDEDVLDQIVLLINLGYPVSDVVERGLSTGNIGLLNVAFSKGWRPLSNEETIQLAIQTNDSEVFRWLEQHGVVIPVSAISYAVENCDLNIVEFFYGKFRNQPDLLPRFREGLQRAGQCQDETRAIYDQLIATLL